MKDQHSGEISEKKVRKTVAAIIVDKEKLLLVKRKKEPFTGTWVLPGGHINEGENDETAITREVKEEVGLNVKPKYFGSYDETFTNLNWSAIVSVFLVEVVGKKIIKIKKDELTDFKWFDLGDLEDLDFGFNHKNIVEEYLNEI